ncbi:hypothetical protein BT96DRAFT_944364 [Gymnopus androsaceus JB14]|uniref:Uncharacterized protein n=1 Tax=Gymnopus androsaceus JB14 TaxID=1447944 RepID=A0A6A4H3P9_9AGAR|nr:hypothetical protein BT96DRAFT_944364 [Gymnopus androsaceus JB14]
MGFNSDSSLPTSADENNNYSYRIYAGTRGIVETGAAKDSATEPTSRRNTKVRKQWSRRVASSDRGIKTRSSFHLVFFEQNALICGLSVDRVLCQVPKRTPTPRKTAFLDQRSLSPEDYKDGNIKNTPSLAAAGIAAHRGDKITTDATKSAE